MSPRWLLALSLLVACADDDAAPIDAGFDAAPLVPISQLDVLFVIDDSGTMREEQEFLAGQMTAFAAALEARLPAERSLHLGVISTSVSIPLLGEYAPKCLEGPDGRLQAQPGCLSEGTYLVDEPGTANHASGIAAAASCLVQLGEAGCAFEQPLQALSLALHAEENIGFLRDDAALLVIVLSNEDDCSASDQAIFDPSDASPTSALGPMESYRCTEFGLECAEGKPGRAEGAFTGCRAQADSPYLFTPAHFRDELVARKGDVRRVAVMTVAANPQPVYVGYDSGRWKLLESCVNEDGIGLRTGSPAVRLAEFAGLFTRSAFLSICDEADDQLARAAELAATAMGH